ncbi:MAG TPA: Gldg family protein [Kiritimatiellia bacterium]|nr:Gldg family protein [Kiritimatiellia bacterium]HOR97365.1 Gldg family protein [Kiritimatiellia bacterium]HPC49409.1 Gldg family protein [Kiritimatiellia bacterium]HPK37436.1 Gldg family protein [Kiritimatiellia bacterium]HPW74406.1 Gldg family protein [Kiritimatiellia bacterium]
MARVRINQKRVRNAGRRGLRATSMLAVGLGAVLALLVVILGYRLDLTWEVPVGRVRVVSERTRDVLADTQGTIRILCFMDRRHLLFRPVSRLLQGFRRASRSVAGAEIRIEYVDPRWDLTRAGQLAAWGVPENALVFERQRRRIIVTLDEMMAEPSPLQDGTLPDRRRWQGAGPGVFRGERVCAAAVARLALPYERPVIYWLQGHGEGRFDEYDPLHGFSDIARELKRDGFDVRELALPGLDRIPEDGQVLIIAGARRALAAEEVALMDSFLQRGGRLLYLAAPDANTALEPLLEKWGIRVLPLVAVSPRTLSGTEVVVTDFADHGITRNLRNASVVFGQARCLEMVADPAFTAGADRPQVTPLAQTGPEGWGESRPDVFPRVFDAQSELRGPVTLAAVSERGGTVARDVAFKPTRLCVIGEANFVMNGTLAAQANANRDLFMNAVTWLAGIDVGTAPSLGGDATLHTGFGRRQWVVFLVWSALAVPAAVLALSFLIWARGRW